MDYEGSKTIIKVSLQSLLHKAKQIHKNLFLRRIPRGGIFLDFLIEKVRILRRKIRYVTKNQEGKLYHFSLILV